MAFSIAAAKAGKACKPRLCTMPQVSQLKLQNYNQQPFCQMHGTLVNKEDLACNQQGTLQYAKMCIPVNTTTDLFCSKASQLSTHITGIEMQPIPIHHAICAFIYAIGFEMRPLPVHHAICAFIDAIELLKTLHLPALLQHAGPSCDITARRGV